MKPARVRVAWSAFPVRIASRALRLSWWGHLGLRVFKPAANAERFNGAAR